MKEKALFHINNTWFEYKLVDRIVRVIVRVVRALLRLPVLFETIIFGINSVLFFYYSLEKPKGKSIFFFFTE